MKRIGLLVYSYNGPLVTFNAYRQAHHFFVDLVMISNQAFWSESIPDEKYGVHAKEILGDLLLLSAIDLAKRITVEIYFDCETELVNFIAEFKVGKKTFARLAAQFSPLASGFQGGECVGCSFS